MNQLTRIEQETIINKNKYILIIKFFIIMILKTNYYFQYLLRH